MQYANVHKRPDGSIINLGNDLSDGFLSNIKTGSITIGMDLRDLVDIETAKVVSELAVQKNENKNLKI